MSTKTIGYILIIVGVIIALIFLFADQLGLGQGPGIGWKQIVGIAIGILVAIIGLWETTRKVEPKK